MTRYFPEVVEAIKANLPERAVVDGEIVVPDPELGRLEFETLQQRIHPADSRVRMLAEATPAAPRRVRSARARRRRPHGSTVRRAADRARGRARGREVADPRHAGHDRRGGRAAVVRRVRGGRARRGGGEAARGDLPAGQARDVQDQARAHRRLRRGRVPAPQERPRCRRVAPARAVRRRGRARQRRGDRGVPDGSPSEAPRGAAAVGHDVRRAPVGLGSRRWPRPGPRAAPRAAAGTRRRTSRSSRSDPSASSRSGTTTWRAIGSGTRRSSSGGGPTASRARARSSSWRSR